MNSINKPSSDLPSSRQHTVTDRIRNLLMLFGIILVAGRAQCGESFPMGLTADLLSGGAMIGTAEITAMLAFNGILLSIAAISFTIRTQTCPNYRKSTWLTIPLFLLVLGFALSLTQASDKYLALVGGLNWLSPMIWAMELIQWLDQGWKRRFVLAAIAATGIALTWRCYEQAHWDIPQTVQEIEKDPDAYLTKHGIEPGSLKAHQFLSRVRSQDIGGFFNVSNTAASFFILSITAGTALFAGLIRTGRTKIRNEPSYATMCILGGLVLIFQMYGLWITQSNGGILGLSAAVLLLVIIEIFRKRLVPHWKMALSVALGIVVIGIAIIIIYGTLHNRLPGNSLWVRWQYWRATAGMIADHWFFGVGPENFGHYYPRYMNPAASEVIRDPHSLPLSVWSQWGILGLAGLISGILLVTIKVIRPDENQPKNQVRQEALLTRLQIWPGLILATATIIGIRYLCSNFGPLDPSSKDSVILIMLIVPGIVWLTGLAIAFFGGQETDRISADSKENVILRFISCGLAGFLLHNTIDFAFFQPGVLSTFFMLCATLIAEKQKTTQPLQSTFNGPAKPVVIAGLVLAGCYWLFLFIPVWKSETSLSQARVLLGQLAIQAPEKPIEAIMKDALDLAINGANQNPIDPSGLLIAAQVEAQLWQNNHDLQGLDKTEHYCLAAQDRDPFHFRYPSLLADIFDRAAKVRPEDSALQNKAICYLCTTLQLNPIRSDLMVKLAEWYEKTGQIESAITLYQKALHIESLYQEQQRLMHGSDSIIVPRLSLKEQQFAQNALKRLAP